MPNQTEQKTTENDPVEGYEIIASLSRKQYEKRVETTVED